MTRHDTVTVNLDQLHPSAAPVRRDVAASEAHNELVASIRAHGLLEPLVVARHAGDAWRVVGGNRRLAALKELAAQGELDPHTGISCALLADGHDETEIALAENTVRVAMHPVDQAVAFYGLHERGATLEQIANRFGTGKRVVARRIRLAALAPPIMQAYRNGEITEELAHAFATTADAERQMSVWADMRENGDGWEYDYYGTRNVLDALEQDKVRSDSWAATFVGDETYRKAGGTAEDTLFEEYSTYTDIALLERLCKERLEAEAAKVTGWKWVQATTGEEWQVRQELRRIWPKPPTPTAAEQAILDDAAAFDESIRGTDWDALSDEERQDLQAQINKHRAAQRETQNEIRARAAWTPEQMAASGVLLYIDRRTGKLGRIEGLLREGDVDPDAKPVAEAGAGDNSADATRNAAGQQQVGKRKPAEAHSQAVRDSVTTLRTAVLRHAVATNDQMAVDLLTFHLLAMQHGAMIHYGSHYHQRALQIGPDYQEMPETAGASEAVTQYCAAAATYDMSWFDAQKPLADNFEVYLAQPLAKRAAMLAGVVANLLLPRRIDNDEQDVLGVMARHLEVDYAGEIAEADRSAWNTGMYWDRLRKDTILDEARPWLGAEWADGARKLKKRALSAQVAEKMRTYAASYLPDGFVARREAAADPASDAD